MHTVPKDLAFIVIGGGKMAEAILPGAIEAQALSAGSVVVADPDPARREVMTGLGLAAVGAPTDAVRRARGFAGADAPLRVLLAIKPQAFAAVAAELAPVLAGHDTTVISILAGMDTGSIRAAFGPGVHIIRAMPNMPARIREGITALAFAPALPDDEVAFARRMFQSIGDVIEIDEQLMNVFTAVAGSGPAYVFYVAEAMYKAAVALGFEPDVADRIVRKTISGAGSLLLQSDLPFERLRESVTSKGGTTAAAVEALDDARVMHAVMYAVTEARDRGEILSKLG